MPYVFKDPKQPSTAIPTASSDLGNDQDDSHNISSLFATTSLRTDQTQQSVHKLDKSPLGSRTKEESQEERRKKALQRQQRSRQNQVEYARRLAFERITVSAQETEKDSDEEVHLDGSDIVDEEMGERKPSQKNQKRTKQMKQRDAYRDQVMFAEWLIDIPDDLYENWCLVCCPVGKRCLVISANGQTVSRLRSGRTLNKFESILPAGSSTYRGNKVTDYCILDCIFDPVHWIYYVLDIMCWKGHPIYDCDTEFRFYWRATKIQPEEMDTPTPNNQFYKFQPLSAISTTEIKNVLANPHAYMPPDTKANLDGYLLYSRQSQYVIGTTPLACWVSEDTAQQLLANPLLANK